MQPSDIPAQTARMCAAARRAARALEAAGPDGRTGAIRSMADHLEAARDRVLAVNAEEAEASAAGGAAPAFVDRLRLDADRFAGVVAGLRAIADQQDPVGQVKRRWSRPNGLEISEVSVPLGVIGVIFESRPNVAADAAGLCVRAANGLILRGGSEAARTVCAMVAALQDGLASAGLPREAVQTPPDAGRAWVTAMLELAEGGCDLVIPRGGKPLIRHVQDHARVPVLSHLDGICHVYLDASADPEKAMAITLDSKMRRTGVCNAAETLLVDRIAAQTLLPPIARALALKGCQLRGDEAARALVPGMDKAEPADWDTEYLDAILSVAVVDGVEGAVSHIARHGSGHTDAIVAEDAGAARAFLARVDSAVVLHNASTAFADGGEFGYGAEIGIATGRLHARGPVGAAQLTTIKTLVRGSGQVRG